MKQLFLLLLAFVAAGAVHAQNKVDPAAARLLGAYLKIKDALVAGNAVNAAANADSFVTAGNMMDYKVISEDNIRILTADAGRIAASKNLQQQRTVFANLSKNMVAVAQAVRLSDDPLYIQYCPMQKASWLSADKSIKNPYYGSAMLTCGQVQSTIE